MLLFSIFFLLAIADAKLIFVNLVHRHGDRSPEFIYPTDPYQATVWENGLGMLSNLGKNQLYDLGKFMRKRYSSLLPINYYDSDLHAEASEMSRTLMSAYCSITALYQPQGKDVWSPFFLNWQPIPVYSLAKFLDNKILSSRSCPQYIQLRQKVYDTEVPEGKRAEYEEVLKNVSNYVGLEFRKDNPNLDNLNSIAGVYDTLFIEDSNNLKLPDWTRDFYPEPLSKIFNFFNFELPNYSTELKRLRCGSLLREMIQHFDDKIDGNITQKWWHYSGHDITIADILNCLNVYDGDRPSYASAVFLELHLNSENEYEVSLVYRKSKDVMQNLTIPNCEARCPLKKFKELVSDVIPKDWEEECINWIKKNHL